VVASSPFLSGHQLSQCLAAVQEIRPPQTLPDGLSKLLAARRKRTYLHKYGKQSADVGRPGRAVTSSKTSKALTKRVPEEVRFDPADHWITSAGYQSRCAVCSKNTKKMCLKCRISLHEACFPLLHNRAYKQWRI